MTTFNVALMQLLPTGSQAGNLLKGLDSCKKAKQIGADLALFPEMWHNGYMLTTDTEETRRNSGRQRLCPSVSVTRQRA